MKKYTLEEEKTMVDAACSLFNEAIEKANAAKSIFKKLGFEICDSIDIQTPANKYSNVGSNIQLTKGITKLGNITGEKPYFVKEIIGRKFDRSRKYVNYKNLIFLQLGYEVTNTDVEFSFE